MTKALLKDPVVRVALAMVAFIVAPSLVPVLGPKTFWAFAALATEIPLIIVAMAAFEHRLGQLAAPMERRFWHLWTAGFGFLLAKEIFGVLFPPADDAQVGVEIVRTGLGFAFFLCIAAAIESRPELGPERAARRLPALERVGAFVFIFGQLVYFAVAPGVLEVSAYWTSSLVLLVVLDGYLVYRLTGLWRAASDPTWQRAYLWLGVTTVIWLFSDTIEMMAWANLVPAIRSGTPLGLLWVPAFVTVVIAARGRHLPARESRSMAAEPGRGALVGPLVVYAVSFPLLHFLFHRIEIANPELKPIREIVALVFLVVLALLGAAFQQMLRRENRRLELERQEAQSRVQHQAYHDALTGLPNRLLFNDRLRLALAQARRQGQRVAVLFLDLDDFKVINDSRGHTIGDELLKSVAQRLRRIVRDGDTVARLGGDEFIVLVEWLRLATDAARVATALGGVFRDPFTIEGLEHHVSASIGVAVFPEDGEDEVTLVKNADVAMYQAKRDGRNTYRFFTPALNAVAGERLALEESLRKALDRDELFLDYQPIVDLETRRLVGAEALVRWRHPERGVLYPGAFIELAETTGLVVPMGRLVLRQALEQAARWHAAGLRLVVAANLSARQLKEPGFTSEVDRALRESGVDPALVELEVTESMAIEQEEEVVARLEELRELGVRVSLDDFGTRYSSLSRLRTLPIDTLKIDRSFVSEIDDDPQSATIIAAVVTMAGALGLQVIVEGIEREEQLEILTARGCRVGQGYLFCRPVPPEQVEALSDETNETKETNRKST